MLFGDIARSMEQHRHNVLALRHQHLFRSPITRGGSTAAVYSRPPWGLMILLVPADPELPPPRADMALTSVHRVAAVVNGRLAQPSESIIYESAITCEDQSKLQPLLNYCAPQKSTPHDFKGIHRRSRNSWHHRILVVQSTKHGVLTYGNALPQPMAEV